METSTATARMSREGSTLRVEVEFAGTSCFIEAEDCTDPVTHDFLALLCIFAAMRSGQGLHVAGPVSEALLRNLEEFQDIWSAWRPGVYHKVSVTADEEVAIEPTNDRRGIFAFSAGVDSAISLARHVGGQAGRASIDPVAAVLVHGFDIPLRKPKGFERARESALHMTKALDAPLRVVRTNWRETFCKEWEDEFATGLVACLSLYSAQANFIVLGADEDYGNLVFPWGSNPVSNPFLSGAMTVRSEAGGLTRTERVNVLAGFPEVAERLRVCWRTTDGDNCGVCEKCIRTKLNFMANGHEPMPFDRRPTEAEILGLTASNPVKLAYLREIKATAKSNGINEPWVKTLDKTIAKNARLLPLMHEVVNPAKKGLSRTPIGSVVRWARRMTDRE